MAEWALSTAPATARALRVCFRHCFMSGFLRRGWGSGSSLGMRIKRDASEGTSAALGPAAAGTQFEGSGDGIAAIRQQAVPRDVGGVVGSEESHHSGHLFRGAHPARHRTLTELVLGFL